MAAQKPTFLMLEVPFLASLTEHVRRVAKNVAQVQVGQPFGPYTDPIASTGWMIFRSDFWEGDDVAHGIVVLRDRDEIPPELDCPDGATPEEQEVFRVDLRAWTTSRGVVLLPGASYAEVLAANGAPSGVKVVDEIPAHFVPPEV